MDSFLDGRLFRTTRPLISVFTVFDQYSGDSGNQVMKHFFQENNKDILEMEVEARELFSLYKMFAFQKRRSGEGG